MQPAFRQIDGFIVIALLCEILYSHLGFASLKRLSWIIERQPQGHSKATAHGSDGSPRM